MKFFKSSIICLVLFFELTSVQAQNCINYFTGNQIYATVEAADSIWVTTECRLVKVDKITGNSSFYNHFSGEECFSYRFNDIVVDNNNNLWMGAHEGLYKFDGTNWFLFDSVPVFNLKVDSGNNIWYTRINLLTKFDGNNFNFFSTSIYSGGVADLLFDKNNNIWMATYQSGLVFFDGINFTKYDSSNSPLLSNKITALGIDSNNNIWLAGYIADYINFQDSQFVAKFDGTNWNIYTYTHGLPSNSYITSIAVDTNQTIWFGTFDGLIKYDGINWIKYDTSNSGLVDSYVYSILIDNANNKWIGTKRFGLIKYDDVSWNIQTTANSRLPGNVVKALVKDTSDNLWIGTYQIRANFYAYDFGFSKFTKGQWTSYNNPSSQVPHDADAIINDVNGNLWVANERNLYKYDGMNWYKRPVDLYGSHISLVSDHDGNIWCASTYRNLMMFDGLTITSINAADYGFNYNSYRKLIEVDHQNNVWIGTKGHLAKFDGDKWVVYNCKDSLGLPCWSSIQALKVDNNNNLWIGDGARGLVKFDGQYVTKYKTRYQGTYHHNIYSIKIDAANNVWIGTFDDGLLKYDGSVWTQYNTSNSDMIDNDINAISADSGKLWLGTNSGLIEFDECGGNTIQVSEENILISNISNPSSGNIVLKLYPNPFDDEITIAFYIPQATDVEIVILDLQGRNHFKMKKKFFQKGEHSIIVDDLYNLRNGVYIGMIKTAHSIGAYKLIKMK